MTLKNTKGKINSKKQSTQESQRKLENILDEYKIISLQLFEYSDEVQETDEQCESIAIMQEQLLDSQQALLTEAQSIKIESGKDVLALLELWKADNIYSGDITPSQGVVLHLQKHFEKNAT